MLNLDVPTVTISFVFFSKVHACLSVPVGVSEQRKAVPPKPAVPTRKQSLDGRCKPDDYDYTSEARKLPSAATGGE
jgi:hypothetical protein